MPSRTQSITSLTATVMAITYWFQISSFLKSAIQYLPMDCWITSIGRYFSLIPLYNYCFKFYQVCQHYREFSSCLLVASSQTNYATVCTSKFNNLLLIVINISYYRYVVLKLYLRKLPFPDFIQSRIEFYSDVCCN